MPLSDETTLPPADRLEDDPQPERRRGGLRVRARHVAGVLLLTLLLALLIAWSQREQIAGNVIGAELAKRGIPATYEIERIGGTRQVLGDVVIGDPRRPDLTIERAEVRIRYTLGWPRIGRVTLIRPRLRGSYRRGTLSFGTLDPLIFREPTGKRFEFPDLDLRIVEGTAMLDSEFGPVGIGAQGAGNLRNGFRGQVAVAAPRLEGFGCSATRAGLSGALSITQARPRLDGPLRVARLACPASGLSLADATLRMKARLDEDLGGGEGTASLTSGAFALGQNRAAILRGDGRVTYRDDALTMRFKGSAGRVATPAVSLAGLASEGIVRARDGFARIEYQGDLTGVGLRPGPGLDAALAAAAAGTRETLFAPLIEQARRALQREARGSRVSAALDLRRSGDLTTLVVPQAQVRGGSGAVLLDASRVQFTARPGAVPRLSGNFATGGPGVPRIAGRMERSEAGRSVLSLAMAEYRAGTSLLALPRLVLIQARDGTIGFSGTVLASGALPGGFVRGLVAPVEGAISAGGELALFRRCATLRFDALQYAQLTLDRRALLLCPQSGAPIARIAGGDLRLAFGTPSLDLSGRLGQSPVRIVSGPVGFAYPGLFTAREVQLALGPEATTSRFRFGELDGRIGRDLAGSFSGGEMRLFATPIDVTEAHGRLRFADGRLSLSEATMTVTDRAEAARFEPLTGRGASVTLAGNQVDAEAVLHDPGSNRAVARAVVRHDIGSGRGQADLFVDNLLFDESLQPADLTRLALGVVANARGEIRGTGQIGWTPAGVTSTGTFTTDDLDFAAPFGPVQGMSGTVRFADLLGMVTEPDQQVRVASINPGIEVTEGVVRFELLRDGVLRLKGASWPFLGGTLSLAATDLRLGVVEARRYTLVIEGLEAARFVERMGLANITATGVFDGELPLVFGAAQNPGEVGAALGAILSVGSDDPAAAAAAAGGTSPGSGRIEGGRLVSRPPGGNLSYVGDLTYRDLTPMANFAFQTLRSLDYQQMTVTLNGALEGEIVTQARFDGVRQGEGAKRNILTRAVANLPIRFIVNIRAPFYQLITSLKALYDPASVKDPRVLGLIDEQGRPLAPSVRETLNNPGEPGIQPSESETVP